MYDLDATFEIKTIHNAYTMLEATRKVNIIACFAISVVVPYHAVAVWYDIAGPI